MTAIPRITGVPWSCNGQSHEGDRRQRLVTTGRLALRPLDRNLTERRYTAPRSVPRRGLRIYLRRRAANCENSNWRSNTQMLEGRRLFVLPKPFGLSYVERRRFMNTFDTTIRLCRWRDTGDVRQCVEIAPPLRLPGAASDICSSRCMYHVCSV